MTNVDEFAKHNMRDSQNTIVQIVQMRKTHSATVETCVPSYQLLGSTLRPLSIALLFGQRFQG